MTEFPRFPRFALSLSLLTAIALRGQTHTEIGDAGKLLASVQVPTGSGALTTIQGGFVLSGFGLNTLDVDLFLIQIDNPATFTATAVVSSILDDPQLFLFDINGRGVTHCDNTATPFSFDPTLTGAFVERPGQYLLAVCLEYIDPVAKGVGTLWASHPSGEYRPDGPQRLHELDEWGGINIPSSGTVLNYTISLTGVSYPRQQIVLPDTHTLSASPIQTGSPGSTDWWRTSGGRFQILYEASHFTNSGLTGTVLIQRLKFRGEDGEPNRGGQSWTGVTVQLGATSLTSTTISTTFANNRAAATTTLGQPTTTSVLVWPAAGSTPNTDTIVIDLAGAFLVFDPTSSRPNLLIDVTMPTAATAPAGVGGVMSFQDAAGASTVVRGAGITAASATATSGVKVGEPPIVGLEFTFGFGGYRPIVPARNEYYGAGCGGSTSTFYEGFLNGQGFDLTGLTLTPDAYPSPTRYTITYGAPALDSTKINAAPNSVLDDAVVPHPLGFTFQFPGGATSNIQACTNGYIWLENTSTLVEHTPTITSLLGLAQSRPRLIPFWTDLHPGRNVATHANAGLHTRTDTSGGPGNAVCYVTWYRTGIYNSVSGPGVGGHAVYDLQCVLHQATGVVQFRYGSMPKYCAHWNDTDPAYAALVGFTRGLISAFPFVFSGDPASRDLSTELPFTTGVENGVSSVRLRAVATPDAGGLAYGGRMFPGQSLTWNAFPLPAGALLGVQLLGVYDLRPGSELPWLTAQGCVVSALDLLWEVTVMPPSSVVGTVPFVVPPGFAGTEIYAQYAVLDGLFGGGPIATVTSNAIRHVVGLE